MKTLMMLGVLCLSFAASATDYVWTGEGGNNYWTNKYNWAGNAAPKAGTDNRVVFDVGGTTFINNSNMALPRTVIVKSGDVTWGGGAPYTSIGNNITEPLTFDIAEGSTLLVSNRLERGTAMNVAKTGLGKLVLTRPCGGDSGYASLGYFDVQAGEVDYKGDANWIFYCTNLIVRKDAVFKSLKSHGIRTKEKGASYGGTRYPCFVNVEEGGALYLTGGTGMTVNSIEGGGEIRAADNSSYTLALTLEAAGAIPVFDGTLPDGKAKISTTTGNPGVQYLGSAGAFGGAYSVTVDGGQLGFMPGVEGEFKMANLSVRTGSRLNLEDTEGNPVTVSASGTSTVRTSGSGSIRFTSDRTLTGDCLQHTGALLADAKLTFGDGTDAANDFDFSTVSSLDLGGSETYFKNVGELDLVFPVKTSGVLDFYGDATVRQVVAGTGTSFCPAAANVTLTIASCVGALSSWGIANYGSPTTVNITGGLFCCAPAKCSFDSDTLLKTPTGTLFVDEKGGMTVHQTGGDVYLGNTQKSICDRYELCGGKLSVTACIAPYSDARTCAVLLNGGTLAFNKRASQYDFEPFNGAKNFDVTVGPNGVTLTDEEHYNTNGRIKLTVPVASGVTAGVDGGITQKMRLVLAPFTPLTITGPYRLMDGQVEVVSTCDIEATPALLGTGDTVIGNARIYFGHMNNTTRTEKSRTLALAAGTGAKLVASGAAEIYYTPNKNDAAQHVTAGALGRTRGGVLFLSDANGSRFNGTADASSMRFTETIPEKRTSGILKDPVVIADAGINGDNFRSSGSSLDFATVTESGYVKTFTATTAGLNGGADSVALISSATTLARTEDVRVAALKVEHAECRLNEGGRVRVGDGENPGLALLETPALLGSGTLDFGAAEGVVVINNLGDTPASIPWKIEGEDGVSFVSTPWSGKHRIKLTGQAAWRGTTTVNALWLDVQDNTTLGDKVVVGAGERCGGVLAFGKPVVFTGDIEASGWGIQLGTYDSVHSAAAVVFEADAEIAGDVKLTDEARIIAKGTAVRGTISGTVSGDRLSVYRGTGTLVLSGDNTYAGGTLVRQSTLALVKGGSAGTGKVTLDGGTLAFDNTTAETFTNTVEGVGTVALKGSAPVLFRNDMSGLDAPLDLCGTRQAFTELPPFAKIVNSDAKKATIALAPNLGTVAWGDYALEGKISLDIGEGTVLDLGGRTLDVYRLERGAIGKVVNGTVNEEKPIVGILLIVR